MVDKDKEESEMDIETEETVRNIYILLKKPDRMMHNYTYEEWQEYNRALTAYHSQQAMLAFNKVTWITDDLFEIEGSSPEKSAWKVLHTK